MSGEVTGWLRSLLGFPVKGAGVGTDYKHARRVVLGTRLDSSFDDETKTLTLGGTAGRVHDESGLVELFDTSIGLERYNLRVAALRGLRNHVARPHTNDMLINNFQGRDFISFNGTTQGMITCFPELNRATRSLAIYVHGVALDSSARTQSLVALRSTDLITTRLELSHNVTNNVIASGSNATVSTASATGWENAEERVWAAVRTVSGVTLYVNGAQVATAEAATTDPTLDYIYLEIGNNRTAYRFNGLIRRIAVYAVPHAAADVAAIDSLWRGY